MQHAHHGADSRNLSEYALVYYYLFAGLALVGSVVFLLPRVASQ